MREKVKILELETENSTLKEKNKILEEKIKELSSEEGKEVNCETCGAGIGELQHYKCIRCFFTVKKYNCDKCKQIYIFKCNKCVYN